MRAEFEPSDAGRASLRDVVVPIEPEVRTGRRNRGEELLRAINDGDPLASASLLTTGVRFTAFDRGEIREVEGRYEVCAALSHLSRNGRSRFIPRGSRVADDAVFFWGGDADETRPGWMITLFFQNDRFSDIRIYLLG